MQAAQTRQDDTPTQGVTPLSGAAVCLLCHQQRPAKARAIAHRFSGTGHKPTSDPEQGGHDSQASQESLNLNCSGFLFGLGLTKKEENRKHFTLPFKLKNKYLEHVIQ